MRDSAVYAEIYSSQLLNECDLMPELCEEDIDAPVEEKAVEVAR
jgi:hypothetical protein